MKTINTSNRFIIAAIALLSFSCKKENTNVQKNAGSFSYVNARTISQQSIEDLISLRPEPEVLDFNMQELRLAKGLTELLKNTEYLSYFLNTAKESNVNAISLKKFFEIDKIGRSNFNEIMLAIEPGKEASLDFISDITSKYKYKGTTYELAANIVNANSAVLTKGYFVAISQDIYIENGVDKNYIPAYHVTKQGNISIELIDEQRANQENEPIIIVTPIQPVEQINGYGVCYCATCSSAIALIDNSGGTPPPSVPAGLPTIVKFKMGNAQIYNGFDQSNSSEYAGNVAVISGTPGMFQINNASDVLATVNNNPSNYYSTFNLNGNRNVNITDPLNQKFVVFTYEYDWYAMNKFLTGPSGLQIRFKSKFDSDVYVNQSNVALPYTHPWGNVPSPFPDLNAGWQVNFTGNGLQAINSTQ